MIAQQGHPYLYRGARVIALESGSQIKVLYADESSPSWRTEHVDASCLEPQPLRYLGHQFP